MTQPRFPSVRRRARPIDVAAALLLAVILVFGVMLRPAEARYAAIVIDAATGEVLHEDSADAKRYPASLTKMMTLYMTFDALDRGKLKLKQPLPVSRRAAAQPPTRLGLRAGQTIRVEDAILALVTRSANDAAVVLAEALGKTEAGFAKQMNAKARQLGMKHTAFRNASGLPDSAQVSTARDMAILGRALIRNHARHYHYFKRASFTYQGRSYRNHNGLMSRYAGMDGLKTGYINASGYNLAASAVRDGRRLIAVVMGGQSPTWRDDRMAGLLDTAFKKPWRPPTTQVARAVQNDANPIPVPVGRKPVFADSVETVSAMGAAVGIEVLDSEALNRLAEAAARSQQSLTASDLGLIRPAAAAEMPPAESVTLPGWSIQIGAFRDRTAARQALDVVAGSYPSLLAGASPQLIDVHSGGSILYRARLAGLDERAAQAACAALKRSGGECFTVPPAGL